MFCPVTETVVEIAGGGRGKSRWKLAQALAQMPLPVLLLFCWRL